MRSRSLSLVEALVRRPALATLLAVLALSACGSGAGRPASAPATVAGLHACPTGEFPLVLTAGGVTDASHVVGLRVDGSTRTLSEGEFAYVDPSLSGDARKIVYLASRGEVADAPAPPDALIIRDLQPLGSPRLLVRGQNLRDPDLTADGRLVAVSSKVRPGLDAVTAPPAQPSSAASPLMANPGETLPPPPSTNPPDRVYVIDATSGEIVHTVSRGGNGEETQEAPAISPDGSQLAYFSTSTDGRGSAVASVRVTALTGRTSSVGESVLTVAPQEVRDISWSPDGSVLAITRSGGAGAGVIAVVDLRGRLIRTVSTDLGVDAEPADAQGLVFSGVTQDHRGSSALVKAGPDGRLTAGAPLPVDHAREADTARCALGRG